MTAEAMDRLTERGLAIYEEKLKPQLEPERNGQVVAIHVDTEDYALGRNSYEAMRGIRARHPDGRLVILTIGQEPDYALAARFLAGEGKAGRNK